MKIKQNILLILIPLALLICCRSTAQNIQNPIVNPTHVADLSQPEKQIIIPSAQDTAEVINQLQFEKFPYDSLFSLQDIGGHQIIAQQKHVRKRDFILPALFLVMLIYVAWLRYVFAKELGENVTVILNSNLGQQIFRDREFSANIFKLLTFVNFTISAGVLIYLMAKFYNIQMPFEAPVYNIAVSIVFIILLYIIKRLIYSILSVTFKVGPQVAFFRFNAQVIYHLLGIGLLPFIILAVFAEPPVSSWALYGAYVLVLFALFLRLIKGFSVIKTFDRFSFVYFLLYFCALEIAPILIAVKLFTIWG